MVIVLVMAAMAAGCATGVGVRSVKYPNAATSEMRAEFARADELYRSKRFAEADAAFARIIAEQPYTEFTDESRFRRGEIAFGRKEYAAALELYRQAVSQIESPRVAPKAHFKAALALFRLNRRSEVVDELARIDRRDASAVLRTRADSLAVHALAMPISKGAGASPKGEAVRWYLFLLDDYAEGGGNMPSGVSLQELITEEAALQAVKRWVDDRTVTAADIEALPLKEMRGKRSGGYASYKRALILQGAGETKEVVRELRSFLSTYPKHEHYGSARMLMTELGGAVGQGAGISIGVLLPLSGKYAVYGESVLRGIECAVGVHQPCSGPSGMRLVVRDSESTAGGVAGAVDELAAEEVMAIVGPLMSASALEAAGRAEELEIPMIAVSQRPGLAEVGEYVFQSSVSDGSEILTLAEYAVNQRGWKRFFIIHPPTKKGTEYRGLFTDAVQSLGGRVTGSQVFSPVRAAGPADELRGRYLQEQQLDADGSRAAEQMIDFSIAPGGYDALFVPDAIGVAAYIAQKMSVSARGCPQLLGISRWDDQRLVGRAGSAVDGAIFVDSFYKGAPDAHVSAFVSNFQQAYGGVEPTMLEALGYDAMRMIISAIQEKGAKRRASLREALARTSNFPGVTGKISFDDEGRAKREMWVLSINDGRIEPAP